MIQRRYWLFAAAIIASWLLPADAKAQQPIGQCFDQTRGQAFFVYPNFWMVQAGNPYNQGQAVRDPSGMTFLRLPSTTPMINAFFVDWSGRVVEINPYGMRQIGHCQFAGPVIPANPFAFQYQAPQMANWGVRTPAAVKPVPTTYAITNQRYGVPLYATEQTARQCMQQAGNDRTRFADCMMKSMLGKKEYEVYDCGRKNSNDKGAMALCMLSSVGGPNEKRAIGQVSTCYNQHKSNWNQYPLCMASQNMSEDAARLLSCVQKQSEQGSVSFYGTATCYVAGSLRFTPEQQIAIECAVSTGGQPYAFAACAGGQLTARELDKCFQKGIGGDGCFGPNNEIVKALRALGVDMGALLGPNNTIVRNWNNVVNDLRNGPGPNNEVTKAIQTVSNDLANGPGRGNDIVKAVDRVIPGFSNLF